MWMMLCVSTCMEPYCPCGFPEAFWEIGWQCIKGCMMTFARRIMSCSRQSSQCHCSTDCWKVSQRPVNRPRGGEIYSPWVSWGKGCMVIFRAAKSQPTNRDPKTPWRAGWSKQEAGTKLTSNTVVQELLPHRFQGSGSDPDLECCLCRNVHILPVSTWLSSRSSKSRSSKFPPRCKDMLVT